MIKKLSSRQVGVILLSVSVMMAASFFFFTNSIKSSETRACELECGGVQTPECPMTDSVYEKAAYYFSSSFIIILLVLGLYMVASKSEKLVLGDETKFDMVLSMLNEDEKQVLKAIKEQEGIKQSTLKYRVDFSKAKLSNLLKQLEKRGLIKREEAGKTYKIFLRINPEG